MKHEGEQCHCGCVIKYPNGRCVDCVVRVSTAYQSANRPKINAVARQKYFNDRVCGPKITKAQAMRGLSVSEFKEFKQLKLEHPRAFAV